MVGNGRLVLSLEVERLFSWTESGLRALFFIDVRCLQFRNTEMKVKSM